MEGGFFIARVLVLRARQDELATKRDEVAAQQDVAMVNTLVVIRM